MLELPTLETGHIEAKSRPYQADLLIPIAYSR